MFMFVSMSCVLQTNVLVLDKIENMPFHLKRINYPPENPYPNTYNEIKLSEHTNLGNPSNE